ncbi:MAG: hypothetical protein ABL921_19405, partial [Pirellula sp.]
STEGSRLEAGGGAGAGSSVETLELSRFQNPTYFLVDKVYNVGDVELPGIILMWRFPDSKLQNSNPSVFSNSILPTSILL